MPLFLWMLFLLIIIQRFIELRIAGRNEKWMKERGGIELGKEHYKWFILIHALFFFSIMVEIMLRDVTALQVNFFYLLYLLSPKLHVFGVSCHSANSGTPRLLYCRAAHW